MTPWLDDGDVRLYHGDALEQLALMPSESVQCIVTSPPFWGLRDYGTGRWEGGDPNCEHDAGRKNHGHAGNVGARNADGNAFRNSSRYVEQGDPTPNVCRCGARRVDDQIGLEETPDEWCAKLVAVMREARRVLRSDGVAWVELGDSYNAGTGGRQPAPTPLSSDVGGWQKAGQMGDRRIDAPGLKIKDLVGGPWMVAFALRADGWYLRSDTIWARPNPMPESVTDRPTKAHSYVFLLTKSARYFYDADAIREPITGTAHSKLVDPGNGSGKSWHDHENDAVLGDRRDGVERFANPNGRNARSVWIIATEPTPFAHFATFPQALVERCIKAGTSEHGCCSECGAPWRRITERGIVGAQVGNNARTDDPHGGRNNRDGFAGKAQVSVETLGWEPSCACPDLPARPPHDDWHVARLRARWLAEHPPAPCVVLDPFVGSGTTCLVARRLGRHAIGIELNEAYLRISAERLRQPTLWSNPT